MHIFQQLVNAGCCCITIPSGIELLCRSFTKSASLCGFSEFTPTDGSGVSVPPKKYRKSKWTKSERLNATTSGKSNACCCINDTTSSPKDLNRLETYDKESCVRTSKIEDPLGDSSRRIVGTGTQSIIRTLRPDKQSSTCTCTSDFISKDTLADPKDYGSYSDPKMDGSPSDKAELESTRTEKTLTYNNSGGYTQDGSVCGNTVFSFTQTNITNLTLSEEDTWEDAWVRAGTSGTEGTSCSSYSTDRTGFSSTIQKAKYSIRATDLSAGTEYKITINLQKKHFKTGTIEALPPDEVTFTATDTVFILGESSPYVDPTQNTNYQNGLPHSGALKPFIQWSGIDMPEIEDGYEISIANYTIEEV
jgi:hypothetical protein